MTARQTLPNVMVMGSERIQTNQNLSDRHQAGKISERRVVWKNARGRGDASINFREPGRGVEINTTLNFHQSPLPNVTPTKFDLH